MGSNVEAIAASPSGGLAAETLSPFFTAARPQVEECVRLLEKVKRECTDIMRFFGETEQTMAKLTPQAFFKLVTSFAGTIEAERKTKVEKLEREKKRLEKSTGKTVVKEGAPPAKETPAKVKLRTAED
eukprot:Gregarina_sp_Poly_1__187@NODE_1043_length_5264_cov_29_231672_g723_i0_p7_GENE_NODE_1043_length_5264_cov_29_231672_g723_i0NODE_1043_length_5264_cov_29_231672_g723_i0_p7_ORF_typecomplete_len128_score31_48FH2/PF02181_23/2_8e07FH2/PF02181_23/3_6e02_NODE_1043_length_5264_cov_29_231672_g723_i014361819